MELITTLNYLFFYALFGYKQGNFFFLFWLSFLSLACLYINHNPNVQPCNFNWWRNQSNTISKSIKRTHQPDINRAPRSRPRNKCQIAIIHNAYHYYKSNCFCASPREHGLSSMTRHRSPSLQASYAPLKDVFPSLLCPISRLTPAMKQWCWMCVTKEKYADEMWPGDL